MKLTAPIISGLHPPLLMEQSVIHSYQITSKGMHLLLMQSDKQTAKYLNNSTYKQFSAFNPLLHNSHKPASAVAASASVKEITVTTF